MNFAVAFSSAGWTTSFLSMWTVRRFERTSSSGIREPWYDRSMISSVSGRTAMSGDPPGSGSSLPSREASSQKTSHSLRTSPSRSTTAWV